MSLKESPKVYLAVATWQNPDTHHTTVGMYNIVATDAIDAETQAYRIFRTENGVAPSNIVISTLSPNIYAMFANGPLEVPEDCPTMKINYTPGTSPE